MKRHYKGGFKNNDNFKKQKQHKQKTEQESGGFRCSHCRLWVVINPFIGTANRNHCNICLWSKHVDEKKGDRRASCQAGMRPIGLTYKQEGYGKQGEVMLVHSCADCPKISINRIAGDDLNDHILAIYKQSLQLDASVRLQLEGEDIYLLDETDTQELHIQLFGMPL